MGIVILSEREARVEGPAFSFSKATPQAHPYCTSMPGQSYYTYIVASRSRTLYIGVTSRLESRVAQHKARKYEGFSATYNCNRLAFYEEYATPEAAIGREKQLKGWTRAKKTALIERTNSSWIDLSEEWGKPITAPSQILSS
jgi:putative endonuclease